MSTSGKDFLEVLDCEIGVRPKVAPGIGELLLLARRVTRPVGALLVDFDPAADETLASFVEAERLCCAGIGWEIEREPTLRLRVKANEEQLAVLEKLWLSMRDVDDI